MLNRFNYSFFDAYGFYIGILSSIIVFFIAYFLLVRHNLQRRPILYIALVSLFGHFVGALFNYWYSISINSDSVDYFRHAYQGTGIFGYLLAMRVLDVLKIYILGNSLMGAFFIFGAIGFLGSIYYLLTFKVLLDKISGSQKLYLSDFRQLFLPAVLLLCWPSYFFWSAGLVKDSFSFIAIGMILYVIAQGRICLSNLITFIVGFSLGFFARPYLFIIFMISFLIYTFFNSKWDIVLKISIIIFALAVFQIMMPALESYRQIAHFSGSISDLASYAVRQQQLNHVGGSSIPMPTYNSRFLFLFIPYFMLADLLLPLGIFAKNLSGMLSSIENAFLLLLLLYFFKNRSTWNFLKNKLSIITFYLLYFITGMIFLSIICTNLGLAMRQKIMYVPALLICICLLYAYKRILVIEQTQKLS